MTAITVLLPDDLYGELAKMASEEEKTEVELSLDILVDYIEANSEMMDGKVVPR